MRILHSADWHIGRTFHGHSTLDAVAEVLAAIPKVVRREGIDVVLAAGDIFDSAAPSGAAFDVLQDALLAIRKAGAQIILISGNHDSAARLGFAAPFARLGGVHIQTDPEQIGTPITLRDRYGEVDFYGIPFLEPALVRHRWPERELRNQADVVAFAIEQVRAQVEARSSKHLPARGKRRDQTPTFEAQGSLLDPDSDALEPPPATRNRSVVLAHTFVAGGECESADSERPIATAGTVDLVPVSTFSGVDYAALGHIHGRARLDEHVRYPGALLHYSFSEAGKPRGGWIVELDASGLAAVQWVDLPIPRPLVTLNGELETLLTAPEHEPLREHWVSVTLTDSTRPTDAMRRLQTRFPWCAQIEHRPANAAEATAATFAQRVQGKTDEEVATAFLEHVRGGDGPSAQELELLRDVLSEHTADLARR